MFFKGFPSMPKGDIVGMFLDRHIVCMFVIDGKYQHDLMAKISMISGVAIMARLAL
jgi:hypothetical protein